MVSGSSALSHQLLCDIFNGKYQQHFPCKANYLKNSWRDWTERTKEQSRSAVWFRSSKKIFKSHRLSKMSNLKKGLIHMGLPCSFKSCYLSPTCVGEYTVWKFKISETLKGATYLKKYNWTNQYPFSHHFLRFVAYCLKSKSCPCFVSISKNTSNIHCD